MQVLLLQNLSIEFENFPFNNFDRDKISDFDIWASITRCDDDLFHIFTIAKKLAFCRNFVDQNSFVVSDFFEIIGSRDAMK